MNSFLLNKCVNSSGNRTRPFEDMEIRERSPLCNPNGDIDDFQEKTLLSSETVATMSNKRKAENSLTLECQPVVKKMIYNVKSPFSKTNVPITLSSLTSDPGSTSRKKDFEPFWNTRCQEISSNLWLPTKTDYVDLPTISSNGLSTKMVAKSLFSTMMSTQHQNQNYAKILLASSQSSAQKSMDAEDIVLRTMKVRIYPTPDQVKKLKEWMHTSRYVYNETIGVINEGKIKSSFYDACNLLVTSKSEYFTDEVKEWMMKTPKVIRAENVKKATTAFKTNKKMVAQKKKKFFKMKFRSKRGSKKGLYSIPFEKSAFSKRQTKRNKYITLFPTILGEHKDFRYKIGKGKKLPPLDKTSEIIYDGPGKWFVSIPYEKKAKKKKAKFTSVSLDPGEKSFQTFYSPDGFAGELKQDTSDIKQKQSMLKTLQSRISMRLVTHLQRQRWKKRMELIYFRLKNKTHDLHYQVSKFLSDNFQTIIIGEFGQKSVVEQKRLNKGTKSMLGVLSHFKFRQRLLENTMRNIIVQPEQNTSKTCTCCGHIKEDMYKDKDMKENRVYKCIKCGIMVDRGATLF